jgi:hypothetical protein
MNRRDYLVVTGIAACTGYGIVSELRADGSSTGTLESAPETATSESDGASGYGRGGYGE